MRLTIDTTQKTLSKADHGDEVSMDLYGKEAFEMLSELWLKLSWNQKYSYTFTWLGRPIIQHPEDLVRMQEIIYSLQPDVIIETGVAHGGSLVFMASLLGCIGKGKIIGVDIEIRPHNRAAIETHPLSNMITLIEGDSVSSGTLARVKAEIKPGDKVLVILDSDHSRKHVLAELQAYHALVSKGSFIVATDGIMRDVFDTPRGSPSWRDDNPVSAVRDFLARNNDFELAPPAWRFNESPLNKPITAYPDAWLKRVR